MISTHVLDTTSGRPAAAIGVVLERQGPGGELQHVSRARTDGDGRVRELIPGAVDLEAGTYRLTFETGAYFETLEIDGFYPRVSVLFMVRDPTQHHHVPLLLSPYGYATYRGS
jgi:5-hydroxyisourate hydrolase